MSEWNRKRNVERNEDWRGSELAVKRSRDEKRSRSGRWEGEGDHKHFISFNYSKATKAAIELCHVIKL